MKPWHVCLHLMLLASACATASNSSKKNLAFQWISMGASAVEDGDAAGALQYVARAEQAVPREPSLHHVRALAYALRKDLPSALSSARRAYELAPADSSIATTYGKFLMESGNHSEAIRILTPAANDSLYRESYKARTNLAILYLARNERSLAREQLDRAINESQGMACHAHFFRSQIHMQEGRVADGLKDLDAATKNACSAFAEAHLASGIALSRNRQYSKARQKFLEVSKRFSGTEFAEKALENLKYLP
ncbi:MAG: tetratricopeptide repeat protein [Oligoflexia bacterium]